MGSSTASALLRRRPDIVVILASRDRKSYDAAIKKRPELANAPVISPAECPYIYSTMQEPPLPPLHTPYARLMPFGDKPVSTSGSRACIAVLGKATQYLLNIGSTSAVWNMLSCCAVCVCGHR